MSCINRKLTATALLLVFLSFTMIASTRAMVNTPGVIPGGVFVYDVTSHWSSSDEYASVPPELLDVNQTESFEVRIHNVTDSNVTLFMALYFKNGSNPIADYGVVDLDTGVSYSSFAAIISGNLNSQALIHPLGSDGVTINETVIKSYESGNRETNRIVIETVNSTTGVTGRVDRYFDKETGMLVESYETTISGDSSTTTVETWKLRETNGWVVPEFPSVLVLPLLMAITIIAAVAYKKKHTGIAKPLISI